MLNKKILNLICISLVLLSFVACSSKAKISPSFSADELRSLAVLPTDYPDDIRREKVDSIVKSVKSELANKSYVVLADRLVDEVCTQPACPERKILTEKYQVDGFVTVAVRSVSRTNFLAGFYNAVKGKLIISDEKAETLVEIEETKSERGGLLFNSGQIIQGLISYANNSEEESFSKLSNGFALGLVSKIPTSKLTTINNDAIAVSIKDVNVKQIEPEIFQVCADATPDSLVSVVVNKQNTNLRSVSEGKYCGTFIYNQPANDVKSAVYVDARSPFGNSVRKEIQIKNVDVCDLSNKVLLTEKNGKPAIQIYCADISNGKDTSPGDCQDSSSQCSVSKFIVFKANSNLGPYEKVAEFKNSTWIDRNAKQGSMYLYELVSVNKSGAWSLPVEAKTVIKEG